MRPDTQLKFHFRRMLFLVDTVGMQESNAWHYSILVPTAFRVKKKPINWDADFSVFRESSRKLMQQERGYGLISSRRQVVI